MKCLRLTKFLFLIALFGINLKASDIINTEADLYIGKLNDSIIDSKFHCHYYLIDTERYLFDPVMLQFRRKNNFKEDLRFIKSPQGREEFFTTLMDKLGPIPQIMDSQDTIHRPKQVKINSLIKKAKKKSIQSKKALYKQMIRLKKSDPKIEKIQRVEIQEDKIQRVKTHRARSKRVKSQEVRLHRVKSERVVNHHRVKSNRVLSEERRASLS